METSLSDVYDTLAVGLADAKVEGFSKELLASIIQDFAVHLQLFCRITEVPAQAPWTQELTSLKVAPQLPWKFTRSIAYGTIMLNFVLQALTRG